MKVTSFIDIITAAIIPFKVVLTCTYLWLGLFQASSIVPCAGDRIRLSFIILNESLIIHGRSNGSLTLTSRAEGGSFRFFRRVNWCGGPLRFISYAKRKGQG